MDIKMTPAVSGKILNVNGIMSYEKVCILGSTLPEDIQKEILFHANGMIHMTESLMKSKSKH